MDKDMLNIIRYAARCEAGINTLTILMEDYKNQDRTAIPISTLETIISTINEE